MTTGAGHERARAEWQQASDYIKITDQSLLLFCLYSHFDDIRSAAATLSQPPQQITVRRDEFQIFSRLRQTSGPERQTFFVVVPVELGDTMPAFGRYLDLHREELLNSPDAVVIWLPASLIAAFVHAAPNFWAWNSGGIFEVEGIADPVPNTPPLFPGNFSETSSTFAEMYAGTPPDQLQERLAIELDSLANERRRDKARPERIARLLMRVEELYGYLGKHIDALKATEEAVQLYRQLAEQNPTAFLPDLALSLNNLGVRYNALGRREEALTVTEEAVSIRRVLAEKNPDAFNPGLAGSLNNLGAFYDALGRREEALTVTEEAVSIRRVLAEKNPEAFNPDLAGSLNNLGIRYNALGRREEALTVTEEATDIYRVLAENNPDAFNPDLAMSLNNLGAFYDALGRREEALTVTEEAVSIRRVLAEKNPEAFNPDLAGSLNNLGIRYNALGRREEALTVTEEATDIYRVLAENNPEAFNPDLAMSLNNIGDIFKSLGKMEMGLPKYAEALKIIKKYTKNYPDKYRRFLHWYSSDYLSACEATKSQPDPELLLGLDELLNRETAPE